MYTSSELMHETKKINLSLLKLFIIEITDLLIIYNKVKTINTKIDKKRNLLLAEKCGQIYSHDYKKEGKNTS